MKAFLILCAVLLSFGINVNAQATNDTIFSIGVTPPPAVRNKMISNHIGETMVIFEQVYDYKVINDKIKSLDIGAKHPDQIINVILMGECYNLDVKKMIGQKVCFKGVVSLRKGKTHMIISKLDQITGYKQYE